MSTPYADESGRKASLWAGPFRWFFVGRAVDLAGGALTPVVIALGVLHATGSASQVGIVMAANVAPTLALMLVGGIVADRWPRARVLTATCATMALTQAGMAGSLFATEFNLALMSALAAATGMVGAFNNPALRGIVPDLVDPTHIQQANAALATVRNAAKIAGPALAGILIATVGGGWALVVDSASFAIAALCFSRLPRTSRASAPTSMWRDLVDGWATFISLRWVWTLSLAYTVINLLLIGPWQILGPVILSKHHEAGIWGAVLSVRAIGLLLASATMFKLRFANPLAAGLLLGTLCALPLLALSLTSSLPVLIAATLASALGFAASGITYEMTLQTHIPREKLSRVSSYDDLLAFASVPISQAVVGPLADTFGARTVVIVCAAGIAIMHLLPLASSEVRTISTCPPAR